MSAVLQVIQASRVMATVASGIVWRRSRQISLLAVAQSRRFSVPMMINVKATRVGTITPHYECCRCRGKSTTGSLCDHKIAEQEASEAELMKAKRNLGRTTTPNGNATLLSTLSITGNAECDNDIDIYSEIALCVGEDDVFGALDARHDQNPYVHRRIRSPFPCVSDMTAARKLEQQLAESDRVEVLSDKWGRCLCRYESNKTTAEILGEVSFALLVTSNKSPRGMAVRDWVCKICERVVQYDGFDDGLFASSRNHLYFRSSLDAIISGPLRDGITGCFSIGQWSTMMLAILHADTPDNRVKTLSGEPGRRQVSESVACCLALLGDAPGRP
jgi:hypothetical protein